MNRVINENTVEVTPAQYELLITINEQYCFDSSKQACFFEGAGKYSAKYVKESFNYDYNNFIKLVFQFENYVIEGSVK